MNFVHSHHFEFQQQTTFCNTIDSDLKTFWSIVYIYYTPLNFNTTLRLEDVMFVIKINEGLKRRTYFSDLKSKSLLKFHKSSEIQPLIKFRLKVLPFSQ